MDDAEGFFPERRLLAYRRSLLSAEPACAATAKNSGSVWWILLVCIAPSYIPIWVSMYPRYSPHGALRPLLIVGSSFLVACALIVCVLGIFVGGYRGLRSQDQAPRNIL
jgi:hypothetical protein